MFRTHLKPVRPLLPAAMSLGAVFLMALLKTGNVYAAETNNAPVYTTIPALTDGDTNSLATYEVQAYVVEGKTSLSTNELTALFSKYTGPEVSLRQIEHAATDLEWEYVQQGYPNMNVVIAPRQIKDGVVKLDVFPGAMAQIIVSGNRYLFYTGGTSNETAEIAAHPAGPSTAPTTNSVAVTAPRKPEHRFPVKNYAITGNTLLSPKTIAAALTNAPEAFGTNVSFDGIRSAVAALQGAYRERGYVTVSVGVPPQKLTNDVVKLQVIEGRLAAIDVKGNFFFSSNNVMRALPSLHTNMILNSDVFQAELNRANANQDRQIYPVIEPGPDPGTSDLTLKIKDRLPLHAKVEYNNQSSPGTPQLRLNTSAVYDNLWDLEHSIGVQYGFSPGYYKDATYWHFYDRPLVANYSAFYRMPLGNPASLEDALESQPGSFGFDEATRKFNLPPASGQPELNIFASRSTIDTGLKTTSTSKLVDIPGVQEISEADVQQDLTENNDVGFRLSAPLPATSDFHSDVSGGLDFKTFETTSIATNNFKSEQITVNAQGQPNPPIFSTVSSPKPVTYHPVEYLPFSFNYDASWHSANTTVAWGLGVSANPWVSGSLNNFHTAVGSTNTATHWGVLTPRLSIQFPIYTNWMTLIRADGQWASEPLLSNEQFGAGGVNSVRGYREGEVFGDTGWHVTFEQQTPAHVVGMVYGNTPLILRGTVYMDYAQTYLLDPQGRPDGVALWGTGVGCVASFGPHWETRFLFSVPLLHTTTTETYEPFFNFALTAQF